MAKKKTPPSKGKVATNQTATAEGDQPPNQVATVDPPTLADAQFKQPANAGASNTTEHAVTIPLYDDLIGTPGRRCDIQNMTMEQKSNLRRLRDGLEKNGSKLKDGTVVQRDQSAIKYLLENLKVTDG